jgi:hypothetical protein
MEVVAWIQARNLRTKMANNLFWSFKDCYWASIMPVGHLRVKLREEYGLYLMEVFSTFFGVRPDKPASECVVPMTGDK